MSTSTGSRPLMGPAADDLEGDADTEESGSTDNINENSVFDSEQTGSNEKEPLSMKRRIAFVGALLLCVFTIFAFAFLLPCHKARCQKFPVCPGKGDLSSVNWTDKFSGITPGIISLIDVTGDSRPDVLVEFDIEEKESKNSSFLSQLCKSKNCHGGGVLAIDGSCGNNLWVFSRNSSFRLLACERVADVKDINDKHCLLLEERKLVLFNVDNGTTKWQSESSSQNISSFKFLNDVDGDGVRDIVFINEWSDNDKGGNINLLSGKTGKVIGGSLPLPESHSGSDVLAVHAPSSTKQFVIVGSVSDEENSTSLWAISMHDLSEKVRDPTKQIPGEPWGKHLPDPATGFISILKDSLVLVQPLLADLDADGVKDVIFLIREDGISLLAVNGSDLAVMWKMVLPSDVFIHKLFQSQHSVTGNSTDVVLFVAYANHSTSLLVIDGPTGEISWSFHHKTGLPVAPIPVLGVFGMQSAFVIWIPKSESQTLISKSRKSRQMQQGSYGNHDDDRRSVDGYGKQNIRKLLLSTASDSAGKEMQRHKRQVEDDWISESDSITPSDWQYLHDFVSHDDDNDHFNDSNDDEDDDDDKDEDKEFDFGLLREILKENVNDSPFAQRQLFDQFKENNEADNVLLSTRNENSPGIQERGYNEDSIPLIENPKFKEEVGPQEERSDVRADPETHSKALINNQKKVDALSSSQKKDEALINSKKKDETSVGSEKKDESSVTSEKKDLTLTSNQKKDEVLFSSHKKEEALRTSRKATPQALDPRVQSIPKVSKDFPPEPTRQDKENDFQKASLSDMIQNRQFLTGNDKQEHPKLRPAKKQSHHKRSVHTAPLGPQCARSSDDDADSYVAVLLMKNAEGRQQIAEITQEGPLYLDAEEYESLFNVEKADVKSTSCVRLVPSLISEPALRDTEDGLDLVYTVSFVAKDGSLHVGKVRKLNMEHVFERLKSKTITLNTGKRQSKRENDYSFSFPRILK